MEATFIYKVTEVRVYMSASCQPGNRVIRAFSDVENSFTFSDLAVKKGFNVKEGSN